MREQLWLWLRNMRFLRRLYSRPFARKPMDRLSYMLVPSRKTRPLRVRTGPATGLIFDLNPRWETHLWEGHHELAAQQVLVDLMLPGAVFYDVGAGFGFYSSLAARLGAQVFAFEPDPENARSLRHHAIINALAAKINIVELAVLAEPGATQFARASQERGHGNGQVDGQGGAAISVDCTSLDHFASRNAPPDLIKIDVEGSESEVFKGSEELFLRRRPSVICEVHDEANAEFVSSWLKRKQYSVRFIEDRAEYPAHLIATPNKPNIV
jgi:FkbM family methyltransferase